MESGMTPFLKRGAIMGNKYGLQMYQQPPPPLAYQQMAVTAMQLQQQPIYVPITSKQNCDLSLSVRIHCNANMNCLECSMFRQDITPIKQFGLPYF